MYHITLDTNTWIYFANGTEPVRILHYIVHEVEKANITVLLPITVKDEWNTHKDKTVKQGILKHFNDVTSDLKRILKLFGDKKQVKIQNFLFDKVDDHIDKFADLVSGFKTSREKVEEAVANNIGIIDKLFRERCVVIEISDSVFVKAGKYALAKKAPFKMRNSFADAVILFSLLEYVKSNKIEQSMFISYNTDDFCENKEGKKHLHPDLVDEFNNAGSRFYKIVGEAISTIKEDIVSKEELEHIIKWQDEIMDEADIEYCRICNSNNERFSPLYFNTYSKLVDNRPDSYFDPNQLKIFPDLHKDGIHDEDRSVIDVGHCSWCNGEHFICVDCNTVNEVLESEYNSIKECEGCGLNYVVKRTHDHDGFHTSKYFILPLTVFCDRCGLSFDNQDISDDFCKNCVTESFLQG